MRKEFIALIFVISATSWVIAQESILIPIPDDLPQGYPRIYITNEEKQDFNKTIEEEEWAREVLNGIHNRIDPYVERHRADPEWIVSRLQMYWKTKSTRVYINGVYYSHAEGEAPVPTVRFTGARDYTTQYAMPDLEDIIPYMDDERGLYLRNKSKKGEPLEWIEPSKTGGLIHRHNQKLVGFARDAAFLHWLEEDAGFARFAFDIFDTYMMGMYYRSEPIDLLNGHIQTLVGLTCFQVIHESTLIEVAELYDFLHQYIERNYPERIRTYDETIKKWIDLIIKNGVPQNNWNLHQAKIILKAAMVLADNTTYADGKGRDYYINYILNITSPRQWSLTKFMNYGYDENNGVWAECPGYSMGVTKDLTHFIADFQHTFGHNILPYTPIMTKAVKMLPQYLFPNGQTVAFGDSYYGPVSTQAMRDLVRIAQESGNEEMEKEFTSMIRLFRPDEKPADGEPGRRANISSFFGDKPLHLNPDFKAKARGNYITQTFYAPNVSWHVQRIGTGKHGLMVSLNGSLGNHMHANGINMELYGKGYVQGADPGRGAGYLQPIYLEYYSQFPAHNTVMVDGTSSYTEMLSNHAFDLISEYPPSEQKSGYYEDITYAEVYFLEPESRSDQDRLVSVVHTGETSGYYLDIFRSRKQQKGDKFHDYFYHNLGQSMQVMDAEGKLLRLQPSEEMAFAGGHLYALDYMWDKRSVHTDDDIQVEWKIDMPTTADDVFMNLWMKGSEGREVFSIKSPPNKAFRGNGNLPYEVGKAPYLTFAARQHGEAWDRPFISIFEPFTSTEGKSIATIKSFEDESMSNEFVGLHIIHSEGREDFIFSSYTGTVAKYKDMSTNASYALIGNEKDGDFTLFMGKGSQLEANSVKIVASQEGNIVLELKDGIWKLDNDVPVVISTSKNERRFQTGDFRAITL